MNRTLAPADSAHYDPRLAGLSSGRHRTPAAAVPAPGLCDQRRAR